MADNIIIDPFSQNFETHEIKLSTPYPVLDIIVFEGEKEYKKAAKPGDFISGLITNIFLEGQNCLLRDTLFLLKQRNPRFLYFILRKKGS